MVRGLPSGVRRRPVHEMAADKDEKGKLPGLASLVGQTDDIENKLRQ